jgi:hypothetical protein
LQLTGGEFSAFDPVAKRGYRRKTSTRMFFRKSPYVYSRDARPARVLALYSSPFIGDIRIKPFLDALLERGVIDSYRIADRAMKAEGPRDPSPFTHIWAQRNVSTAQFAFLRKHSHVPIIYDMDDLLTSMPAFVASSKRTAMKRLDWCLQHASAITVASDRLKQYLLEDAPTANRNIIVLKNGCALSEPPEPHGAVKRLVWTSSDVPFFLRENPQFIAGLAALLNRNGYEAVLIGRFDEEARKPFERSKHIDLLDFVAYRRYLRTLVGGIAIAPLPTRLPASAQRYFDAKSDVKLIDYLSSGLIPVVSDAAPYATSELFMPQLAASTADEMLRKIGACIADPVDATRQVDAAIHRSGLLRAREFSALSKALDPLLA